MPAILRKWAGYETNGYKDVLNVFMYLHGMCTNCILQSLVILCAIPVAFALATASSIGVPPAEIIYYSK